MPYFFRWEDGNNLTSNLFTLINNTGLLQHTKKIHQTYMHMSDVFFLSGVFFFMALYKHLKILIMYNGKILYTADFLFPQKT